MFYELEPEVAGGFGKDTELDNSTHPPIVNKLHIEFDGWLGDSLLECFPVYLITEEVKSVIESSTLTGFNFDYAKITVSEQFKEIYPNLEIPDFTWLKVIGDFGKDDFSISNDNCLVVSQKALDFLKGKLENCDITSLGDKIS